MAKTRTLLSPTLGDATEKHLILDPSHTSAPELRLSETTLVGPISPTVSSKIECNFSPEERFEQSFKEIKSYVQAHSWDAAAMFFGTAAYMGVYYLQDYFKIFGVVGRYIVHNLAMGITANAVAVPFVKKARLCEGQENKEANQSAFRYFLLCSVPDSLYQPVEDWFIAVTKSGSPIQFDFVQDAVAEFSPVEVAASFAMFGVSFGLLYFFMKKLLLKHDAADATEVESFEDRWLQFYKKSRETLQSPSWESVKSALQYFIFYLSDYLFDLSLRDPQNTLLNLLGCCVFMSGYSFVFDNVPELLGYLQIRRERWLALQQTSSESLDADYVQVDVVKNELDEVIAVVDKLVEKRVEAEANDDVILPRDDSSLSIATTESFSSIASSVMAETLLMEEEEGEHVSLLEQHDDNMGTNSVQEILKKGTAKLATTLGIFKDALVAQVEPIFHAEPESSSPINQAQ